MEKVNGYAGKDHKVKKGNQTKRKVTTHCNYIFKKTKLYIETVDENDAW